MPFLYWYLVGKGDSGDSARGLVFTLETVPRGGEDGAMAEAEVSKPRGGKGGSFSADGDVTGR